MALKLIENAKKLSKERFLAFTEEMYGTNNSTWEYLWQIPTIPTYCGDQIFPFEFESIDSEEILDILDALIEKEIGKEEAVYIPFEKILIELPEAAQIEFQEKMSSGVFSSSHNATIVYHEGKWQNEFKKMVQSGLAQQPPKSQEEMSSDFSNLLSQVFQHERMHSNTHILMFDPYSSDESQVYTQYGARFDDILETLGANFEEYDEVFIDTIARIVETHQNGESIRDTLYRIIENRNGKSAYELIDDRPVLVLLTLFPDELTHWAIMEMGALHKANVPTNKFHNLLAEKYSEVFHDIDSQRASKLFPLAHSYFHETRKHSLAEKDLIQCKEMLKMLGIKNIDFVPPPTPTVPKHIEIDIDALFDTAVSAVALEELSDASQDLRAAQKHLAPTQYKDLDTNNIGI